jgi:hypothetical protein
VAWAQNPSVQEKWIERNHQVSKYFDSLARELDYLLSGQRTNERNETQLTVAAFADASEVRGVEPDAHINLDLNLPAFEEEMKLRLSSFDAEDEFEGLARNRTNARPQQQKLGTSVAVGRNISGVKVIFRPRVELRDPLLTSFLLKFTHSLKGWLFNVHSQVRLLTHSRDGVGQSAHIYFERPLSQSSLFRWFNEQQYLDQFNLFSVAQGLMVLHKASDKLALSYTVSFNSQNRSTGTEFFVPEVSYTGYHLNSYQFIFSFHHKLFSNVLHYQVSPSLNFYKDLRFRGDPGILLRTELIF